MRTFTPKALATRERILRAADELFYLHGFTATGVDRIIAEAGVAKGNFFHHFKTKEELAVAVLDWHWQQAAAAIGVAEALQSPKPGQALIGLLHNIADQVSCASEACRVRGCFFGNFALELSAGSEPVRVKVAGIFGEMWGLFEELIRRAQANGEIRAELDPAGTASILGSLMEGAVLIDKTNQSGREIQRAISFIAEYLGL